MQTQKPLISVIIPVFNDEETVLRTLESIQNQSFKEFEAWLIDDFSTDSSITICEDFCAKDNRFHHLKNSKNSSAWVCRAKGILNTSDSVKYIMFADADDTYIPQALKIAYTEMEKCPVDILHYGTNFVNCANKDEKYIQNYNSYLNPPATTEGQILTQKEIFQNFVDHNFEGHLWNKMFNASLLKTVINHLGSDLYLPKAQDKVLYWATCWEKPELTGRIISPKLYNYYFGAGVEGNQKEITLEQFNQYLCQAYTEDVIAKIMEVHPGYEDLLATSRQFLIKHTIDGLKKLPDSLKIEGLKKAQEYWHQPMDNARIACGISQVYWKRFLFTTDFLMQSELFKTTKTSEQIKTIATYCDNLYNGGIQKVVTQLVELWHTMGYQIIVITQEEPNPNDYQLPTYAKRIVLKNKSQDCNIKNYYLRGNELAALLQENKIDCLIYHSYYTHVLFYDTLVCKSMNVPFVLYNHNIFTKHIFKYDNKFSTIPYASQFADAVVCLTKTDEFIFKTYNPNVHTLINPYKIQNAGGQTPQKTQNHNLLFLGRLSDSDKNPLDAIEIFKLVQQEIPDAKLYLVGQAESQEFQTTLEKTISESGCKENIILTGFTKEISQYYKCSSVFLSCSVYEGFMLTLCEAMDYKLPVVMYQLPYLPLTQNNNGIINVQRGNKLQAAQEIIKLFSNPAYYEEKSQSANQFLQDFYKTDITSQWKTVFNSIGKSINNEIDPQQKMFIDTLLQDFDYAIKNNKSPQHQKLEARYENLQTRFDNLKDSRSYKIGLKITSLPRKILNIFKK